MAGRLTNVDGLRGLAALLVIVGHWSEFVAHHAPHTMTANVVQAALVDYFSSGRTGIVAFFCISGLVVPFSFRGGKPKTSFLISRFFRLYPAYWVSLPVGLIAVGLVTDVRFGAVGLLANATMIPLFLRQPPVIGVYWTLHVELIFYALCFVLFAGRLLHNARVNLALMTTFVAIGVAGGLYRFFHIESGLPIGIPTYLAAMHFGTLARLHFLERDERAGRLFRFALPVLVIGVVATNTLGYIGATNEVMGWMAASTGYLSGLALFLLCVKRHWFGGRRMAYVGLISYALYLFHIPMIQFWEYVWPAFTDWRIAALLGTLFVFLGTFAVAAVVQFGVETPMIRLARKIERRWNNAPMTARRAGHEAA